jgi:uroporphyrin-III C-methyltransferase
MAVPRSAGPRTAPGPGRVWLVGAGPGDPDLLTLRALRLIEAAEIVVHDRLVSPDVLSLASPRARRIDVGKRPGRHPVPQEEINALLIDLAARGSEIVRLKGGDPFIFGRGGEEAAALRAAGITVGIVPGITAASGAAASLGLPLTMRNAATGVRFVTGHCCAGRSLDLDWSGLADPATTLVVYMGLSNLAEMAAQLIAHGMPAEMPALVVSSATTPQERAVAAPLWQIAPQAAEARLPAPALLIIGRVVEGWHGAEAGTLAARLAPVESLARHA